MIVWLTARLSSIASAALLAGALLLVVAPATADACTSNVLRLTSTRPASLTLTVFGSKPCHIYYNSVGGIAQVTIATRPSWGRATVGEVGAVIYRAPTGYTGSDSFVYALHAFDRRNRLHTVHVNVSVTIRNAL
jgi:hypothetical protein